MSAVRLSTDFDPDLARCRAFFEAGKLLPLSEVLALLTAARLLLEAEANVLRLEEPVLVVGDIHGQFADLMTILHGGAVAASPDGGLVFLGDYVDRGARGCEVLLYLLLLKLRYPDRVHLLRGNHECRALTGHFGFRAECRSKYGLTVYHECCRVFEALPLAAVVARRRGDVLCCHGGLGPSFDTVGDLEQVDRRAEPLEAGVLCDVLWADPGRDRAFDGVLYEDNDKRGCSVFFGREATLQFLARNGLAAIVRAHEVQEVGSRSDFGPPLPRRGGLFGGYASTKGALAPVTTVFSAPNYCGRYGNTAAPGVRARAAPDGGSFDATVRPSVAFGASSRFSMRLFGPRARGPFNS
ncbi:Metallo-dependent phosphatase-like protein [Pelagophyceae sp. CCMP2097]|nr:Metallo-dependent phosphatase-like protein [Pelagophyceae sp. CCMP2097]